MTDVSLGVVPPSRTPLKVFGVLGILLGVLCLGFAALLLVMVSYSHNLPNGQDLPIRTQVPGVLVFTFMGFLFAALGWGTFMARRWARTLSLIVGWSWLITGVISTGVMAFMVPKMLNPPEGSPLGPSGRLAVVVFTFLVLAVIYIVLPVVGLVFYHLPKTQRAFEAFHPERDWTDQCPPSVLTVVLLHVLFVVGMVAALPFFNFMDPFFGVVLFGWKGFLALALQGALFLYLARGLYRLERKAWFLSVWANGLWALSGLITFWNKDLVSIQDMLGIAAPPMTGIDAVRLFSPMGMTVWSLVFWAAWLGYLIWIGNHFKRD